MNTSTDGWVIEAGDEPLYWTGHGAHDFQPDVSRAIRFARHEDADTARKWICRNHALRVAFVTKPIHSSLADATGHP